MDLGSECSALESVEDNGLITTPDIDDDANQVQVNGSCLNATHGMDSCGNVDSNSLPHRRQVKEGVKIEQPANSLNLPSSNSSIGRPHATTKGYGLKKWRRIKRDVNKDASASVDGSKILKRGLPSFGNQTKTTNLTSVEIKQNSEGSFGSANVLRNVGVVDGFVTRGSSLESRFAVGSAVTIGTDSENSEDRSSKSSTAASAPKARTDPPAVLGHVREKNMIKNSSGKSVASLAQRVQQVKGRVESSKKPRGERVKIEKENSHSSMESDSRSSNFLFMQGAYSVTSNRKQSVGSMNYDGENSDETNGDQQFNEEVQTSYGRENVEVEDLLHGDSTADAFSEDKEEKSENHPPLTDGDPLLESILNLQSAQEALESEVRKLGEIAKVGSIQADSTFTDPAIPGSIQSEQFDSENIRGSSAMESQVSSLIESVKNLEIKLEEAKSMLRAKESTVAELEAALSSGKSLEEESGNTIELREKSRENEAELEGLFKQKIEAEVEYLTLTNKVKKLRIVAGDQVAMLEEQEVLAGEQAQMLNKLGEAETKAAMLKKEAEELEKHCGNILGSEEVLKMQRRVCKVTSCVFAQLVLLILAFWLLVLQLSFHSGIVVPT